MSQETDSGHENKTHRKPKLWIHLNRVPPGSIARQEVDTAENFKRNKETFVTGDVLVDDEKSYIYFNDKLRELDRTYTDIRIPQTYSSITNNALDYFSNIRIGANYTELSFLMDIGVSDVVFKNLTLRQRSKFIFAYFSTSLLHIEFSHLRKVSVALEKISDNCFNEIESDLLEPTVTCVMSTEKVFEQHFSNFAKSSNSLYRACGSHLFISKNHETQECSYYRIDGSKTSVEQTLKNISTQFGKNVKLIRMSEPGCELRFEEEEEEFRRKTLIGNNRLSGNFFHYARFVHVNGTPKTEQVYVKKAYQHKDRHETILDVCIALWKLEIPKYCILEIIDWLPNMQYENHVKKINLIFSVYLSCEKVIKSRSCVE